MKSRKFLAAAAGAFMALTLAACSGGGAGDDNSAAPSATGGDTAGGLVGVAMPTQTSERWIADGDAVKAGLEDLGYQVDLQYANDDIPTQSQQVDQMITNGAKVLIIAAIDGTALSSQLQNAADKDIKVIAYDRLIRDSPNVDFFQKVFETMRGKQARVGSASLAQTVQQGLPIRPSIPKTWDDSALTDWATPVAGLNVRPGHFSAEQYYRAPVDNHRTYPVYAADREPAGYWEMVRHASPKPLIEPEKLKTRADWLEAGQRVFEELDHIVMRSYDPKVIAAARSLKATGPDGRVGSARWIPTEKGLAIGVSN